MLNLFSAFLPLLIIVFIIMIIIGARRKGITYKGLGIETGARSDRQLYIIFCWLSLGIIFIIRLIITEAIRQAQIKSE